jgi:hypothetical protein
MHIISRFSLLRLPYDRILLEWKFCIRAIFIAERRGRMIITPASYSEGSGLKFGPETDSS